MPFVDREDAGRRLARSLRRYEGDPGAIVVALPRGGVVTGRVVADALKLPLDIVVPRKIGAEADPEYAIGAVTEEGDAVWNERERRGAGRAYLDSTLAKERAEARRRLGTYRAGMPPRSLRGKTVLVVDDGVATGYTMRAAVATVKRCGASRIVVAVPVCPADSLAALELEADEVVALESPVIFSSIGAFYDAFAQTDDATVVRLLRHP
ncbi:MAG: hypothetical protein RL272_678 [Candidatus Parcubacteria bacterium]|jgi:predicted phosphoribosyltransferase